MKNYIQQCAVSSLLAASVSLPAMAEIQVNRAQATCKDDAVCRIIPTLMPLKVLPRPRSSIYASSSADSEVIVPNVPALSPLYVFERVGVDLTDSDSQQGWYRVGAADTAPIGWMKGEDVIEWHNSLVLSYTPPGVDDEKRNRVLGFGSLDNLLDVAESEARSDAANELLAALDAREPGAALTPDIREAGIVSAEPANVFLDIKDNFYMWPILSWKESELDPESDERFVEFVQLVPECRGTTTSTASKVESSDDSTPESADALSNVLAGELSQASRDKSIEALQVMFVVDTTGSMEPYIEAVKSGISKMAMSITEEVSQSVTFGFVGYQDQFDELDYVSKDFTEDGFLNDEQFVDLVDKEVKVERWGDHLIPERLFDGVQAGINAQWDPNALKFMVVITDAPGIPEGDGTPNGFGSVDENYVTLMDADEASFNTLADVSVADAQRNGKAASDANISMLVNHIAPGNLPMLDDLASRQLSALVQNRGTEDGYLQFDGAKGLREEFETVIFKTASIISSAYGYTAVELASKVEAPTEDAEPSDEATASSEESVSELEETVIKAVKAAAMDFLGDTDVSECDYRGWTSDRDLADNAVRSLEVNSLLTHNQLDTLYRVLKDIHAALATGAITQAGFVDSLQSVTSSGLLNPDSIEAARTGSLAASGILPKWLELLPYQSAIANLSGEDINALTSAERTQLEINVNQKLQYYQTLTANKERWFALSEVDEDNLLKKVTPLPLEELP